MRVYDPSPLWLAARTLRGVVSGRVLIRTSPTTTRPARRQVRLYNSLSGILVAATWSDDLTGAYRFERLDPGIEYLVMAQDYMRRHNAVVADGVDPV